MKELTAADPEVQSTDILAENIDHLKALFPEAFTEGMIDFEVLKQLLGGAVDERDEKYGLNWYGKRRARQLALAPSTGTLRPCPEESVDWDTTQNLVIEGDNLEVLKLLQKSYAGKVKLMYIDPPYNTGRDFVYPDNFQDNIQNYMELTGQVEGGRKISSNTEASGRFHTDWLNMIYPRLKLARNLLREDGVLMVSVDEGEIHNLKGAMCEIFGDENLVATFVWETKQAARGVPPTNLLMENHEYIVCFARSAGKVRFRGLDRDETDFANPDNDPRGLWRSESMKATGKQDNYFDIVDPKAGHRFHANWAFSPATVKTMIRDGLVLFPPVPDGVPRQKKFLDSYTNETKAAVTSLRWHSTETSTKQLMELFDGEKVFDFPKPLSLIQYLCDQAAGEDDIVLDFFAGSGITAHAVMSCNAADRARRRFILVQLPEPLDPENKDQKTAVDFCDKLKKPRNIAELTKERIRRAGDQIAGETAISAKARKNNRFDDFAPSQGLQKLDLGFRVFKLDSSNIQAWDPDRDNLDQTLFHSVEHLKAGRTEMDILYELLLKLGLDLCVPIEQKRIAGKAAHSVGAGVLMACLAEKITRDEVEPLVLGIVEWHKALAPAGDTTCVFRDSAFVDDVAKTNLAAIFQQYGLTNVRSL